MSDCPAPAAPDALAQPRRRPSRVADQLVELSQMDPVIVDMALVLARAMNKADPYVLLIECARSSSLQLTNLHDEPLKLARFLERFARRARHDAGAI